MIKEIQELQGPYMNEEGVGDVVLVRIGLTMGLLSEWKSGLTLGQVAHGLILRCFVKRWLKLPVDDPLPMMLSPGALAMLRYVLLFVTGSGFEVHGTDTQCYNSYKNHNVNEPAFFVGMALPATG